MSSYQIVTPQELQAVIRRSKVVLTKDSPGDRIVGFECDGKLWGFKVGTEEARAYFAAPKELHQTKTTCETCGHTDIQVKLVPTPLGEEVLRLKTADGRKTLEKPRRESL